jgi:hypothetical protein
VTTVDVPTAVHIGADELPLVDIGDGSKLKVIQVKNAESVVDGALPLAAYYLLWEAEGHSRPRVLVG